MKANFSKYWHFFYCAVIAVLGYLYYNAAFGQEQFDNIFAMRKNFRNSNQLFENQSKNLFLNIQKAAYDNGDTSKRKYLNASNQYVENSKILCNYLEGINAELIEKTGGFDAEYSDGRIKNYKSYFPAFSFFSKKKNKEIQKVVDNYKKNKILIINNLDKKILPYFERNTIVEDSIFWKRLTNSSPASAMLKLEELQNSVKHDEIQVLNYIASQIDNCWKEDYWWQLGINLNQHSVYVGDEIKGDVALFLPSRYLCGKRNAEFFVNGKLLPIDKDGIPYYKSIAKGVGKKVLKIECRVRNPLTDEEKSVVKHYSLIVLPKP